MSMQKRDMVKTMSEKTGVSQKDTLAVLDSFLELVQEQIQEGNDFTLVGFGKFTPKTIKAGESFGKAYPASNSCKFVIGKSFKNFLNN